MSYALSWLADLRLALTGFTRTEDWLLFPLIECVADGSHKTTILTGRPCPPGSKVE